MKRNIIILTLIALIFSGCRKDADYHPYIGETDKLAYDSYSTQFEYLWKSLSSGYVFWDVDETDWDAVYEEYMPKFHALDAQHEAGQEVTLDDLNELYTGAMGGLRDHHMAIVIKNLHPAVSDTLPYFYVSPGEIEVEKRDYFTIPTFLLQVYFKYQMDAEMTLLDNIEEQESFDGMLEEIGTGISYYYFLFRLPDGRKIPYFWQSAAVISYVMNGTSASAQAAKAVVDKWLTAIKETPREQLAGIILDNRANGGGCQDDLDYLVGSFINERTEVLKTRYKEGPGRLEYSPWVSYYIDPKPDYHRDITAENIPFVVLTNICSISMGEIEPAVMRHVMPTVHVIGERTYGATGPLQPVSFIDLNYGGPFGDQNNMNHYIYTSTFEAQVGGKVLEGIGVTPDEIVLFKDHNTSFMPQFDAAIEYIKNYK